MTEKYGFEEFDRETRDYLLHVRDEAGHTMPGVYIGTPNYLPVIGLILGFVVIIVTVAVTLPPTDPPVKEALLQTAGFLFGGWLVLAAVRVWMGGSSGRYAGHFVYADPEYLYEVNGSTVTVTDLADLREAKAVQNYNEGKYQNTTVTLRIPQNRHDVHVSDEERGRRLTVFLNAVAYMRDGGEDGKDDVLRGLSAEAMGTVAKKVATTGEFPKEPARAEEGNSVRVPRPKREGRRSTGILGLMAVVLVGAAMFAGLVTVNYPFRDEAVFARIKELPPKERPPALRLYLTHDKFTAHRDEARQLLAEHYENGVRTNIVGTDADLRKGMAEVVLALKDKPAGVVSLRTVEEVSPPGQALGGPPREKAVREKLADKWGSTIGDELVAFATMDDADVPVNIEVRWKFDELGAIRYTITFRKSPEEQPVAEIFETQPAQGNPTQTADALAEQIVNKTVGMAKIRPVPLPPEDF
jgi:hypothetical protein